MNITDIRIYLNPNADSSKVKAFATITLEGALSLNSIRIVEGRNGLFLGYPQQEIKPRINTKTGKEETAKDIFHPITAEARLGIQDSILSAFQAELTKKSGQGAPATASAPGYTAPEVLKTVAPTPVIDNNMNVTPNVTNNTVAGAPKF